VGSDELVVHAAGLGASLEEVVERKGIHGSGA
jgi:hypothetical protein